MAGGQGDDQKGGDQMRAPLIIAGVPLGALTVLGWSLTLAGVDGAINMAIGTTIVLVIFLWTVIMTGWLIR